MLSSRKAELRYYNQLSRLLRDIDLLFGRITQQFPTEKTTLEELFKLLTQLSRTGKLTVELAHFRTSMFKFKSLLRGKPAENHQDISVKDTRRFWYALFFVCQQIIELGNETKILSESDPIAVTRKLLQRKKCILALLKREAKGYFNQRYPGKRRDANTVSKLSDL